MSARKDLSGKTFYWLKVIELSDKKRGTTRLWKCKCQCGNIIYASSYDLTSKHTKSCGCYHVEQVRKIGKARSKYKVNDIIGHYRLIEDTGKRRDGKIIWKTQCLYCGRYKNISTENLRKPEKTPLCICESSGSFGERKIYTLLEEQGIPFVQEYSFSDLKSNGKKLRFDFFVGEQYLIEYDGRQHFNYDPTGYGKELIEIQRRDSAKNKYCLTHHIPLIRIPYTHFDELCIEDLLLETTPFLVKEEKEGGI